MTAEIISIAVAAPTAPYAGRLTAATRFVADAADHMRALAGAIGAHLTELAGTAARRDAVTAAIRDAGRRLHAATPALLVIADAGHGARVRDPSGEEPDGYDEAWVLDDAPLTDDVVSALLRELHPDIHLVVISNCCFSAGMLDGIGDGAPREVAAPRERWALGSSDHVPVAVLAEATNRVIIASCGDQQMMVLPDASRLTLRVLDAVCPVDGEVRRRQVTDYAAVDAVVKSMASVSQTPRVLASGDDLRRPAFVPQPLRHR